VAERLNLSVNRRTVALLLAAILLPSLIFVALQFGFGYRAERRAYETSALSKADAIMAEIDGNMQRTRASALALASETAMQEGDWRAVFTRAREIARLNYDWKSVRLTDVDHAQDLFDLQRPFGPPRPVAIPPSLISRFGRNTLLFGGISRSGAGCPCIVVEAPVRRDGAIRFVLTILLEPTAFQRELLAHAPHEGTSAVLDAEGNFIARTRDYEARVGTPATRYEREAIHSGTSGLYSGVTYEGLATYTAFSKSAVTGWTTHIGVPQARLDTPMWWSHLASTIALIISLGLAVGLVWALLRVMATQRDAELRLQQAQRLEAVGKMTGGIAHDFNNMLSIIIGSLDLARRRRLSGADDIDRHLDNAMEGANRAAELTRRLLAFSRRQALAPVATDINLLLEHMRDLIARTLDETIRLRFELCTPSWYAFVDPVQFENAVVNLAANARDAMPGGGEVVVATDNVTLTSAQAARLELAPGEYIQIRVIDDGCGMSPETIQRAFEPFFTTKDVGRGTGLGLSQIYGFLDQSGGRVRIRSQEGEGTAVEMLLPRFHGELPRRATESSATPARNGSPEELILVTEDEARVRMTNVEALRELGYSVCHAANGAEALEVLATQSGVKLLFTDIVMPGMNGRELAEEARKRLPNLKLLFATGYERETLPAAVRDDIESDLLRKPFTIDQLARKVREILDS
jgi:signal transduction histidine kinase